MKAAPVVHLHPRPDELVVRTSQRAPMARALRALLIGVAALLWLSGALWLLAHFAFPAHNEFGALPNPWEAPLLKLHGVTAVAAVFLLGWIAAGHVPARWWAGNRRTSGLWLLGCAALLVLSGYALYYTTGALHTGAAALHEWLGLAALAAALGHWVQRRAGR